MNPTKKNKPRIEIIPAKDPRYDDWDLLIWHSEFQHSRIGLTHKDLVRLHDATLGRSDIMLPNAYQIARKQIALTSGGTGGFLPPDPFEPDYTTDRSRDSG